MTTATTAPIVVVEGVTYRADLEQRTIEPVDALSTLACDLLDTHEPIGPQTDELAGVFGTWDHYPRSVIAAMLDAAERTGVTVSWYADDGSEPPA